MFLRAETVPLVIIARVIEITMSSLFIRDGNSTRTIAIKSIKYNIYGDRVQL